MASGVSPASTTEDAPAKINLTLHVPGRRADGYHELQSLVIFTGAGDRLIATEADDISLEVMGRFSAALQGESNNLVLRAARALQDLCGVRHGARLRLVKELPVASGIGGGSADAAAALRALIRMWKISPEETLLHELALSLGADVPVCLASRPAMMWGIGEKLKPLPPLPAFSMVLANPGVAVSTAEIFSALAAKPLDGANREAVVPENIETLEGLIAFLQHVPNDLEPAATHLAPEIGETLQALAATQDCRLTRMSGSGATCFAIYRDDASAEKAAASLRTAHPHWWVMATKPRGQ